MMMMMMMITFTEDITKLTLSKWGWSSFCMTTIIYFDELKLKLKKI